MAYVHGHDDADADDAVCPLYRMVRLSTFPRFLHNVKFPFSDHPRSTWVCRLWQVGRVQMSGCRTRQASSQLTAAVSEARMHA